MATKKKEPFKAKAVKKTLKPEVKKTAKAVDEPIKTAPNKSLKQFIQVFPQIASNLDMFEMVMDLLIMDGELHVEHINSYRKGQSILIDIFLHQWRPELSEITTLSSEELNRLKIIISRLYACHNRLVSYNKDGQAFEYVKGTENVLLFAGSYFIYSQLRIFLQRAHKYLPELGLKIPDKEEMEKPKDEILKEKLNRKDLSKAAPSLGQRLLALETFCPQLIEHLKETKSKQIQGKIVYLITGANSDDSYTSLFTKKRVLLNTTIDDSEIKKALEVFTP